MLFGNYGSVNFLIQKLHGLVFPHLFILSKFNFNFFAGKMLVQMLHASSSVIHSGLSTTGFFKVVSVLE